MARTRQPGRWIVLTELLRKLPAAAWLASISSRHLSPIGCFGGCAMLNGTKNCRKSIRDDGKGLSVLLPSRWRDGDDGSGDAVQRMETKLTPRDDAGVGNSGEREFASPPLARDRLLVMEEDERKNNASHSSFPLFAHADALVSVQLIPSPCHRNVVSAGAWDASSSCPPP